MRSSLRSTLAVAALLCAATLSPPGARAAESAPDVRPVTPDLHLVVASFPVVKLETLRLLAEVRTLASADASRVEVQHVDLMPTAMELRAEEVRVPPGGLSRLTLSTAAASHFDDSPASGDAHHLASRFHGTEHRSRRHTENAGQNGSST